MHYLAEEEETDHNGTISEEVKKKLMHFPTTVHTNSATVTRTYALAIHTVIANSATVTLTYALAIYTVIVTHSTRYFCVISQYMYILGIKNSISTCMVQH